MRLNYNLFPELKTLPTNTDILIIRKRKIRMDHYYNNFDHRRLKRQGTNATQIQKKKGLLPREAYCTKCKSWCEKNILKYHHVNEQFTYAVVPTCPKCLKKLENLTIQTEIEKMDRQIYFEQLFYHEIDRNERDIHIYESAAKSMMKGGFSYNHTVKIVINY